MDDTGPVARAYNKDPAREWERLATDPYHSLEFTVTMHYLRKHLAPTGTVLDAGGGPGRYSLALCRAGYEVVLLDISSGLIDMAREQFRSEPRAVRDRLLDCVVGDVRDLSRFQQGQFDVVLCLGGPLTHISERAGRFRAMSELIRVAKPGAVVSVSVMGQLAVLRTTLTGSSDELLDSAFQVLVAKGDTLVGGMAWHFFRMDELRRLAESCGLATLEMAGCEGLSTGLAEATNRLGEDELKWECWEEVILRTSTESAVVDMAEHILYVGRVPEDGE